MPSPPNSSLYSKNYPWNINYMHPKGTYFVAPAVFFSYALILETIAILGQPTIFKKGDLSGRATDGQTIPNPIG
jgi:hypothetical protein